MEIVLGNLLYDGKGHFVRQFSYGWCCSCGGKPENHCEHIKQARLTSRSNRITTIANDNPLKPV